MIRVCYARKLNAPLGCCSGLRCSGDAFCGSLKVWGFLANLHEHWNDYEISFLEYPCSVVDLNGPT